MDQYIFTGLPETKKHSFRFQIKEGGPDEIIEAVSQGLRVSKDTLLGPSRKREVSEARFICFGMILLANPNMTLKELGKLFSRDHSTIIYGREVYNTLVGHDKVFQNKVLRVKQLI
jgi:chromosomal replication initiation ATPase DnaA